MTPNGVTFKDYVPPFLKMAEAYFCGDVVSVNLDLDKPLQSEGTKTRPCVIIGENNVPYLGGDTGVIVQNNLGNRYSPLVIIACITGAENVTKEYPVDVPIPKGEGGLEKDSVAQCSMIRTVAKSRLGKKYGSLTAETMRKIDSAIKSSLALK